MLLTKRNCSNSQKALYRRIKSVDAQHISHLRKARRRNRWFLGDCQNRAMERINQGQINLTADPLKSLGLFHLKEPLPLQAALKRER